MKLKAMDKNTVAFLKQFVLQHEATIRLCKARSTPITETQFAVELSILVMIAYHFCEGHPYINYPELMEAIKAYDISPD